jgi:hypothetical protein
VRGLAGPPRALRPSLGFSALRAKGGRFAACAPLTKLCVGRDKALRLRPYGAPQGPLKGQAPAAASYAKGLASRMPAAAPQAHQRCLLRRR